MDALPALNKAILQVFSGCNGRCLSCVRHYKSPQELFPGSMSWNLFKKIILNLKDLGFKGKLEPFLQGESFLHPHFIEYVNYAGEMLPESLIRCNTNGSCLTEEYIDMLLDSRLEKIIVSMNAFSEEVYSTLMPAANADQWKGRSKFKYVHSMIDFIEKRIKELKKQHSRLGKRSPKLAVSFIEVTENASESKQWLDYWKARGIETFFGRAHRWSLDKTIWDKLKPRGEQPAEMPIQKDTCHRVNDEICVCFDGTVIACHGLWQRELVLGDLSKSTIEEVWGSSTWSKLRKDDKERKLRQHPGCASCTYI